jgi:membrane protein required for colicin V production
MDWVDAVILGAMGLLALIGLFRGFVAEVVSLVTWLAAILVAKWLAPATYLRLGGWIEMESVRWVLSWTLPFLAVMIAGALVRFLLNQMVEFTGLGGFNRLLGAIFGAFKAVVVITLVVLVLRLTVFDDRAPIRDSSRLLPYFDRLAVVALDPVTAFLGPRIDNLREQVQQLNDQGDAPDPLTLLRENGFSPEAIDYLKKHPEALKEILETVQDNPQWKERWLAWMEQKS